MIHFYSKLLLGVEPSAPWMERLTAALGPDRDGRPEAMRKAVALILAMPEAQLS
jgi:hypothetical protein